MRILGHRGARLVAPENTLAAFRAALAEGADGVELDVRRTSDGVLVCFHDSGLGRTTNGRGPLRERTLAELLALDAGSWFDEVGASGVRVSRMSSPRASRSPGASWTRTRDSRTRDSRARDSRARDSRARRYPGARVPTLAEVLDSLPRTALIDVEVKVRGDGPEGPKEVAALVAGVLAGRADTGRVMVTSFSRRVAAAVTAELPGVRVGLVSPSFIPLGRALRAVQAAGCSVLAAQASAYSGPKAHVTTGRAVDEGILLAAWTVDEPDAARRLADLGVTAVVTDQPGHLARSLRT
ncbi:MAG TPA: glycerophosphodiester phosphodiesterase family protein [Actinomycetes bacterium]|nr:glycerophosphodiester phosphodiesterase family protein [Actinomycetes bacterium]